MIDKKQQGLSNREWGEEAEKIATDWLLTHGYVIVRRHYRVGGNIEIDIIAELPGTFIFIEVKARRKSRVAALEAIDKKKMMRMVRGANAFMHGHTALMKYRFDIITVIGTKDDYTVENIPDAFLPPLSLR